MANTIPTHASSTEKTIVNNLPTRVSPFVNREGEIARVIKLLLDPYIPIVSIVGLAGVGKSALALEVAHRLMEQEQFSDGLCWAYCRDRNHALAELLETVQRTFDLRPNATSPDAVRQYLANRRVLLILNEYDAVSHNLEILSFLEALPGPSKVLLTSRAEDVRLPRTGKVVLDGLDIESGVRLFLKAAESYGTAIPAEQTASVAELVQLLAGHPLAIRLVAAQVGDHDVSLDILRQQIQKGTWPNTQNILGASLDMVSEEARTLFRRLAVFASSFDAQAVDGICQVDNWRTAIAVLEQAGLVQRQGKRYQLHPMARSVGVAELEKHGERDNYGRVVAAYYLQLVQAAESRIYGEDLTIVSSIVRDEITNMLAGQEWYWAHEYWPEVIAYADALYNPLALGGFREARLAVVQRALTASKRSGDIGGEARFLSALADIYHEEGRSSEAVDLYEQSLALHRRVGNRLGEANVLKAQGDVLYFLKRTDEALARYDQALTLFRTVGARLGEANVLKSQGDMLAFLDQLDATLVSYEQALRLFQEVGDRLGAANTRKSLGDLALRQADLTSAGEHYRAALADFQIIGARLGVANTRKSLGDLALRQADLAAASEQYWAALADFQTVGDRLGTANTRLALGDLGLRQDDLTGAEQYYWAALVDYQVIGARLGAANARKTLGDLALRRDDLTDAEQHYWGALVDFQGIGDRLGTANTRAGLGDLALRQDDLAGAKQHYWAALADYQAIGARLGVANTRKALGDLALRQEDLTGAEQHYWAALADFQAIGTRLGEANVFYGLANVHRSQAVAAIREADALTQKAEYQEALQYLDRSSDLFESIGDAASLAFVQRVRARILDGLEERDFEQTISALAKSLTSSLAGASQPATMRAAGNIIEFGKHLIAQGRYEDALHLTTQLTKELDGVERDANRIYERRLSPEETRTLGMLLKEPPPVYQTLIRYDQQLLQTVEVVRSALSVLGRVAAARLNGASTQEYDAALQALEMGRQIDRTTGQAFQLAQWVRNVTGFEFVELEDADEWPPRVTYLVHLAARHERDQNWEAAISTYQQACEILGKAESDRELARAAEIGFRLALCLKQAGRWTEALKQQQANAATYKKLGDVAGKANAYIEMGHIYQMMNLYDPALLYYGEAYYLYDQAAEEATDETSRQAAQQGMANAKESLGNLEFQLKVLPKGISDLEDARKLYLGLGRSGKAALIAQTLEEAARR